MGIVYNLFFDTLKSGGRFPEMMGIQVWRDLRRSLAQPAPQSMSYEIRPAGQGFMLLILEASKDRDCRTILGNASHLRAATVMKMFWLIYSQNLSCFNLCPFYFIPPLSHALSSLTVSFQ